MGFLQIDRRAKTVGYFSIVGQHPKNESLKLKGLPADEFLDEIMVLLSN